MKRCKRLTRIKKNAQTHYKKNTTKALKYHFTIIYWMTKLENCTILKAGKDMGILEGHCW